MIYLIAQGYPRIRNSFRLCMKPTWFQCVFAGQSANAAGTGLRQDCCAVCLLLGNDWVTLQCGC